MRLFRAAVLIIAVACMAMLVSCSSKTETGKGTATGGTGDGTGTLSLDKTEYKPGETINIQFTASPEFVRDAWIGVIPSDVPHGSEKECDLHDVTYNYIEGRTSGVMAFAAPRQPGSYDIRMFDTDEDGSEVASAGFEVVAGQTGGASFLSLDAAKYGPGETIEVSFTAPAGFPDNAWVGIIPSDAPHGSEEECDRYDVSYLYLDGRTSGKLSFNAPEQPGRYDMRMFDTDDGGKEVASVSFEVE